MRFEMMPRACWCNRCARKDGSGVCVDGQGRRCPLWRASGMHPGLDGRACILAAQFAEQELAAFGYTDDANQMSDALHAREAYAFGARLVRIATRVATDGESGVGAAARRLGFAVDGPPETVQMLRTLAIDTISDAGRWYMAAAQLGGVRLG